MKQFLINHHKYIVLINFEDKHYEYIESIVESLSKTIRFYLNITATIVISNEFNGLYELKEAYDRCNELSKWRFYFGYNSIVKAHCQGEFNKFNYEYLELSKEIKELIDLGDFDKSLEIVENFLELCIENYYDPQDIKKFIIFIASYIEGYEIDKGINDLSSIESIKNDILNCELLDKLKELNKNLFDSLKFLMKEANSNKYRKEVEVVIDYINKNINEKITLKMVAQAVNMNESYLSRMFKNETGKNLIYFINEIKMKRALELLKESGSMVKEVANIVGIEDQFYFNKVFKKFYGVSPSEFKKKYFDK